LSIIIDKIFNGIKNKNKIIDDSVNFIHHDY